MFFLTALMHSEDKSICIIPVEEYIKLDQELEASDPEAYKSGMGKIVQSNIKFAQDHYSTVERFGRYPHRNKYLGRESTPEEIEYLGNLTDSWAK